MVNVDPHQRSSRYVSNSEGAPPVPPPGGYRGAARPRGPEQVLGVAAEPATVSVPGLQKPRETWFGRLVLGVAAVFAVVLIVMGAVGSPDALFAVTTLAVQALVVGLVVAGLVSTGSRRFSAIALAVALVFNVATMGAVSSSRSSMAGSYDGHKSADEKLWEQYPGVKDTAPDILLAQPSLEDVRARSEAVMAEIRQALTDRFGYTWSGPTPEDLSPVRNGYGGESMLQAYRSGEWTTNEAVTGVTQKLAVMEVIDDVIRSSDMAGMRSLNDPETGVDPSMLEKFYGGTDISTQPVWEWYSYAYDGYSRMYADVYDLSLDDGGTFTQSRQAAHDRTGEPLEGVQLAFYADALLSEADVDAFREKLKNYP